MQPRMLPQRMRPETKERAIEIYRQCCGWTGEWQAKSLKDHKTTADLNALNILLKLRLITRLEATRGRSYVYKTIKFNVDPDCIFGQPKSAPKEAATGPRPIAKRYRVHPVTAINHATDPNLELYAIPGSFQKIESVYYA